MALTFKTEGMLAMLDGLEKLFRSAATAGVKVAAK